MLKKGLTGWRKRLHEIIFESETWEGKLFDLILLWTIIISALTVILDSVATIQIAYAPLLKGAEWLFTILFTIEYVLRLVSVKRPAMYMKSFFGIVDLLAILPTYLAISYPGFQSLLVLRILRLLRIFRILKMGRYVSEANTLKRALKASQPKITVFLLTVLSTIIITGSCMYIIEGPENGFDSIPEGMYWATVTMTTVGFGDITPKTVIGKIFASMLMIMGYGIIAVPTGIVSVELARESSKPVNAKACDNCGSSGHDSSAKYCSKCGGKL